MTDSERGCANAARFIIGVPQVVGQCSGTNMNTAACTALISQIYALGITTSGLVIGTLEQARDTIDHVDWTFTATTEGFFSVKYNGADVGVELTPTGGRLALAPRTISTLELKIADQLSEVVPPGPNMSARVTGNYAFSSTLVPTFSESPTRASNVFLLGAQLISIDGVNAIVPILLSPASSTAASSLPGNAASVLWSVGRVASGTPVLTGMGDACANPLAGPVAASAAAAAASIRAWSIGLIVVFVVIVIIAIIIAFVMRRTETVSDPRAVPLALAISRS